MRRNVKVGLTAVFIISLGVWFYFTPHLAVHKMRRAAEARDSATLSSYINFPALKESLKASFSAKLASEAGKKQSDHPFAALGAVFAAALINPMIDALVTPESLAMIMKGERPDLETKDRPKSPSAASETEISTGYESFDRFVVRIKKRGSPEEPVRFEFTREGLFSWKLSALRLPL
jgi:hypothetical protein